MPVSTLADVADRLAIPTAAWTAAFVLARFVVFPKRSADFGNRVVSILHALLAMLLAVPALDWTHPLLTVGAENTAAQVSHLGLETVTASFMQSHCSSLVPPDAVHGGQLGVLRV